MKIRYDVTVDDLLVLGRHHFRNSPTARRSILLIRWGGAAMVFLIVLIPRHAFASGNWVSTLLAGSLSSVAFLFLSPFLVRVLTERQQRKLYSEGSTRGVIGMHECELRKDAVVMWSETDELQTSWAGLDRIVATDDYTFIYLSSVTAHVIPRQTVVEGDYGAFVQELMEQFQQRKTAASASPGPAYRSPSTDSVSTPVESQAGTTPPMSAQPLAAAAARARHSGMGIASFVLAIVAGLAITVLVMIVGVLSVKPPKGPDETSAEVVLLGTGIILAGLVDMVALGLGVAGVCQRERLKVFSVLGLCSSALGLVGVLGIMLIGLLAP